MLTSAVNCVIIIKTEERFAFLAGVFPFVKRKRVMIYRQNLHTHTTFCDGKDTVEEMVLEAIKKGFKSIGFSSHSGMSFSPYPSLRDENVPAYKKAVAEMKEKYRDRIDIYCGLEFDAESETDLSGFDYVLGAVHYLNLDGRRVGFDRDAATVKNIIDQEFGGVGLKYAQAYYERLAQLPTLGKFDVVAHFDLITKHSETHNFFDTDSKEYQSAAIDCLRELKKEIPVFELNTGAMARGYRKMPYLPPFVMKELKALGAKLVLSSDCHQKEFLDYAFIEALEYMRAYGFTEVYYFDGKGFYGEKI